MHQRAIVTRQQIIEAAARAFSREGYNATGVAEICKEAGVSKGAFYHHFESKHQIFMVLLEEWLARLDVRMKEIARQSSNVPDGLISMVDVLPGVFDDAGDQVRMYLEFWNQATRDPAIYKAMLNPYRTYARFFSVMLENGMKEGSLKKIEPDGVSRVIISFALGVLLQGLLDRNGADWKLVAETGMKMISDSIREE